MKVCLRRGYRGHLQFKWRLLYSSTVRHRDSPSGLSSRERGAPDRPRGRRKCKREIKKTLSWRFGERANAGTGNSRVPRLFGLGRKPRPKSSIRTPSPLRFEYSIISNNFRARATAPDCVFNPLTRVFFFLSPPRPLEDGGAKIVKK